MLLLSLEGAVLERSLGIIDAAETAVDSFRAFGGNGTPMGTAVYRIPAPMTSPARRRRTSSELSLAGLARRPNNFLGVPVPRDAKT